MPCKHVKRKHYKHTMANGSYHVVERCIHCGANARGEGKWLSKRALRWPEYLEEDPWRDEASGQRRLL